MLCVKKGYVEGSRFAGFIPFLMELSTDHNCSLKILHREKGILTEAIQYQLTGDSTSIGLVEKALKQAIDQYNRGTFDYSRKHKASGIKLFSTNEYEVTIVLKVNRFSRIVRLFEKAATYFELVSAPEIKVEKTLFSKTITVYQLFDKPDQRTQFVSLIKEHLIEKDY